MKNSFLTFSLLFVSIIIFNGCNSTSLSKFAKLENIDREKSNCNKRYSKNGAHLNGFYKVNDGKDIINYAHYKDGYYQKVWNESKGFIWSKEEFDEKNNLSMYTSYMSLKGNPNEEYYQIRKYDSVQTIFKDNFPAQSIFYDQNKKYNVVYELEEQKLKVVTDIPNFKIINSLDVFIAIPPRFFFSVCHNGKLLYGNSFDVGKRHEKIEIDIIEPKEVRHQIFKLENAQKKEDHKIDFYDYVEE